MSGLRISYGLLTNRTLLNINSQLRELVTIQEKLATGHRVNRPSDDPIDARRAIEIRTQIRGNEQFLSSINDVTPLLTETESVLSGTNNMLLRAQELAVRGGNETLDQVQLDQIALEINQLLEQAVVEANRETNGKHIFGGTRTLSVPFVETRNINDEITAVTYAGNSEVIELSFSSAGTTAINEPGDAAFVTGTDIFQLLIDIRDELRAGDQATIRGTRLDEIKSGQQQILNSIAKIGAFSNRLERISESVQDLTLNFEEQLSDKIDADYAETVLDFNIKQNAFQSSLNAAARVLQPSLLDFVR
jgi:flagellar hook-associated protein 3 FlgL